MDIAGVIDRATSDVHQNTGYEAWAQIQSDLRHECGEETYRSWISKLEFNDCTNYHLSLTAPTRFVKDWITTHFEKRIIKAGVRYIPTLRKIAITIVNKPTNVSVHNINYTHSAINKDEPSADVGLSTNHLDKRFTFDNFVVGPSNEFAYTAAKAIAEAKSVQPDSNPLFMYGWVGLGKTHLMQAIAWHILENNPLKKVVYASAEKFMYQFVNALRNKNILQFKERYRSVDILMVDDIQFICGKDSTQEEFFHVLNLLIDNNKQIVISGDRSPSALENMKERIRSRLGGGLVADIHNTTYELRLSILQSKAKYLGLQVPQDILEFIASKVVSNVRELEGALNTVVARTRLTNSDMTLENTKEILRDLLRSNEKVVTIEEIQKKVAEKFDIKVSDLCSSKRTRDVAKPRHMAIYLAKQCTSKSLSEIGKRFGGKDHTTIRHAVLRIESLIKTDLAFAEEMRVLMKVVQC